MKTNIIHKLLLLAAAFVFALSTSAQSNNTTSITLTTTSQPGETIRLLIKANGPVVAEGINGTVKTDSVYYSYPITDKTIKFVGDITNIGCHSSKLTNVALINCTNLLCCCCGILVSWGFCKQRHQERIICCCSKLFQSML